MDGIKLSPPLHHFRRSDQRRLTPANQAVLDPQAIDTVVVYVSRLDAPIYTHERITLSIMAESIARLNNYQYAGICDLTEQLDICFSFLTTR